MAKVTVEVPEELAEAVRKVAAEREAGLAAIRSRTLFQGMHMQPKHPLASVPLSVLIAGSSLALSSVLYILFSVHYVARQESLLTYVAAWHIPLALLAAVLSLYAAVKHRSNAALGIIFCSCLLLLLYVFFTIS